MYWKKTLITNAIDDAHTCHRSGDMHSKIGDASIGLKYTRLKKVGPPSGANKLQE